MMVGVNAIWKDVMADSFCDSVRDGTHDSPKFVEDGHFLITSKNIRNGRVILETANLISEQDFANINRRSKVDQWDVLFSMIGTVGEVCLVREKEPSFAIKNIGLFKVGNELKSKWLYYWLCTPMTQAAVRQACRGASQQYIPLGELRNFPVRVPTKPGVMRKIVDIVSSYDDLIENNRRRIALLEEAARLLYREWFVHFRFPGHEHVKITNGLPDGWEPRTFGAVCQAVGGGTPSTSKPEYWSAGDIPWYTPTDITRNSCIALLDSEKKITEAGLRGSSAKMLPTGTVLMTSRASVGFFGIIEEPSCTNQGFISILPNDLHARMYLLLNLMYRVEEIRSHAGGSTYKEINKAKFKALNVVMPDSALLREFEEQISELHAQVRTLHTMNQKLAKVRDLLLPRLMNGEITV